MIKRVSIYWRNDNPKAVFWAGKLKRWMRSNFPKVAAESSKPQAVIVLGGDGTILAAAQKYQNQRPLIIGLNLGHVAVLKSFPPVSIGAPAIIALFIPREAVFNLLSAAKALFKSVR